MGTTHLVWLDDFSINRSSSCPRNLPIRVNNVMFSILKFYISEYRWNDADLKRNTLRYSLCQAENVVEANRFAINKWYDYPRDTPNLDLFEKPIWTTWARFKESNINISILVKLGASSRWSSFLYSPMRNLDEMNIGKTHPTL